VHKLYSILRERVFFEMTVSEDRDTKGTQKLNLKDLQFEPILTVEDDVLIAGDTDATFSYKCAVDIESKLLSIMSSKLAGGSGNPHSSDKRFFCINMETRKVVFENRIEGFHSHHWLTLNEQKFLSLQTAKNAIQLFSVDVEHKSVGSNEYTLALEEEDVINFYEFDRSFQNIFILKNNNILEKRSIIFDQRIATIELEEEIGRSVSKMLSLSNDGSLCVVSSKDSYFHLIDVANQIQSKLVSNSLTRTYAPCFINGDSGSVAVGGSSGEGVEIWDVQQKQPVQHIEIDGKFITTTFSVNNILAVGHYLSGGFGTKQGALKLYDVSNWELFYWSEFWMVPRSVHLTSDARYLTVGGCATTGSSTGRVGKSEKCVVLEIM